MSYLKVCRICLCKGVKMYDIDSFHLKQYYEEIMAKKASIISKVYRFYLYVGTSIYLYSNFLFFTIITFDLSHLYEAQLKLNK